MIMRPANVLGALRWMCAVERWTTAVALALVALLAIQLVAIPLGRSHITQSPSAAVQEFYQAAQAADKEKAQSLLNAEGRSSARAMDGGEWQSLLSELSNSRSIERLEFGGQRNYSDHAVVGLLVFHTDGSLTARTEELVKEGREWRIMWKPGTRSFLETVRQYEPWFGR